MDSNPEIPVRRTQIVPIIVAFIAGAGAVISAWYAYISHNRELDIKLVEIGIGILRADPQAGVTPARAWAVRVIERYSRVPFDESEKQDLLQRPLQYNGFALRALTEEDFQTPEVQAYRACIQRSNNDTSRAKCKDALNEFLTRPRP